MAVNAGKLTEKAQDAIVAAQRLAEERHHTQLEPEHLLHALVTQEDGVVPAITERVRKSCAAGKAARTVPVLVKFDGAVATEPPDQVPLERFQERLESLGRVGRLEAVQPAVLAQPDLGAATLQQREHCQRIGILTADEAAHRPKFALKRTECVAEAAHMHQPFADGRHDFLVLAD